MQLTREELKLKNRMRASHAANVRWEREHAAMREAGIIPVYKQHHAYGEFEITVKSLRSGKVNVLKLREGERRDNFRAELNGEPWKPEIVSISTVARIIRKSIVKTRSVGIV